MRSCEICSRGSHPAGCPTRCTGGSSTRLHARLRQRLAAMTADPRDETRRQFEEWLAALPDRLETSPELRERGERIKRDVLASAALRDWSSSLWLQAKDRLRTQAADPGSELRRRLAGALVTAGRASDQTTASVVGLERVVESGARALADQFRDELAWPCHRDHRAVGRRRDVEPARAAARARPAIHPDQRHGGGSGRGTGPARHRPGPGLTAATPTAPPATRSRPGSAVSRCREWFWLMNKRRLPARLSAAPKMSPIPTGQRGFNFPHF